MESYTFSEIEIEDLLNNHAYEMAEILSKAYDDLYNELKDEGDFND